MNVLPNIRSITKEELKSWLEEKGQKSFRANQVFEWIWKKGIDSFDEMKNIGKEVRSLFSESFVIEKVEISNEQRSQDGTIKYGLKLFDGNLVEGVLIPSGDRVTACISSQAGCSLNCSFCATGYMDLKRNLNYWEIYDEVDLLNKKSIAEFDRPLSNIVYMGMGEPLLNYKNVLKSIEWVTSPEGLGMSPRRITVSTAGIAKMIKKLGDDEVKFEFALSLHAADDEKRSKIMPINESNSLEALEEALKYFNEKTGTRVTFEYIIFRDFNDTLKDAENLVSFCRKVPSKVNIIEYNPIHEATFRNTSKEKLEAFRDYLESHGIIVNLRRSRGKDVDGACGQLALRNQEVKS